MRSAGAVSGAGSVSVAWPTLVGVETSMFEVQVTGLAEVCSGADRPREAFGRPFPARCGNCAAARGKPLWHKA